MPPQFFVKFQYNNRIKKIGLNEQEFTWDNLSKILSQSFNLPNNRLKLTYKDPEGDEITACCDEDLIEAYRACSSLQPMRFFVYLCNNAHSVQEKPSAIAQDSLSDSMGKKQEEVKGKSFEQLKLKSESDLPEPIAIMEKEKVLSEGAIRQDNVSVEEKQVKVGSQEFGRILEEILLTKEAKEKILQLRVPANIQVNNNTTYKIDVDQKALADCVTGIFEKILNETMEINVDEKVNSVNSAVASLEEIPNQKLTMSKEWKSMEEEKSHQIGQNQSASESKLFNLSLKESIYEKSLISSAKDPKVEQDFKEKSFAGTSMSFCRDLSSTYGVKLALKFENGKMKLMSVPTQEYSIIDSIDNTQKEKSEENSGLKRSASMNECPGSKKNVSPDYSEYFRLSLVD